MDNEPRVKYRAREIVFYREIWLCIYCNKLLTMCESCTNERVSIIDNMKSIIDPTVDDWNPDQECILCRREFQFDMSNCSLWRMMECRNLVALWLSGNGMYVTSRWSGAPITRSIPQNLMVRYFLKIVRSVIFTVISLGENGCIRAFSGVSGSYYRRNFFL